MAVIVEASAGPAIDLDTLLERLEGLAYDDSQPFSNGFIEEAASLLQRFCANRYAVREHIDRCGGIAAARESFVPPQTFLLGANKRFGLRANVWPKIKQTNFSSQESVLYAYGLSHNHDFNLLTIGYYGPGYTTDLHEVDPEQTLRPPGSKVDLLNHRLEQLTEGRVLAFAAFSDLHSQNAPEDLSISINLIPFNSPAGYDQVFFDTQTSTLVEPANSRAGRIATTLEVAAAFPTPRTPDLIAQIAETTNRPRVRQAAVHQLAVMGHRPAATGGGPRG